MKFMNEFDIDSAIRRHIQNSQPNRLGAAQVIEQLRRWADQHSDGWAHWPQPVRAASRLIDLADVYRADQDCSDADLAAAVKPVKAFLTRQARERDRFGNPRVSAEWREHILRGSVPVPS